jgi:hypothetical protein
MEKTMKMIHKYRWVLYSVCIVITLSGLSFFVLRKLGQSLQERAFQDYILLEYMPTQRKKQKKWPSTLNGIEQVVDLDPEIDRIVIGYYRNGFIKMEPILECEDSYVYRLFTKDIDTTCKVTINPDGGYCWSDSE